MSRRSEIPQGKYCKERPEIKIPKMSTASGSSTPPLPCQRTSMEDLIKKREILKKELQEFKTSEDDKSQKYSDSKYYTTKKHSKYDTSKTKSNRKRSKESKKSKEKKRRKESLPTKYKESREETRKELSPEESEDEDSQIERSRQRRKQLFEKLNVTNIKIETEECKSGNNNTEFKNDTSKSIDDLIKNFTSKTSDDISPTDPKNTDMFSEKDEFAFKTKPEKVTQDNKDECSAQLADNWNDSEGYYIIRIGDEIDKNRYTIKGILGQGVFSNVVRAQDKNENTEVAIKIIRENNVTYKTGLKEIEILEQIRHADPDSKHHCIKILHHFMHKNHLCIVLESLYMDLRQIIKKYGRDHGLSTKAVVSYSRQLLLAMRLLQKIGIIHADIKPDNMLVNEKKNTLKLCDFGSASRDDHEITPYLVSRFYRAPEIILGIPFKQSIDVWSAACTIYEMATGKILFPGQSNNKMLKYFMDLKGKMSTKMVRRGKFKDQHFNYNYHFLLHKKDPVTEREKVVETPHIAITRDLLKDLKKYSKSHAEIEEAKLLELKDLLDKMLILDPNHRYTVRDCLKHPFITES